MKRFVVHTSGNSTRETIAAETPREAAEAHVRGLYGLDDADGSHVVTVERDGVVETARVFVTITVHAEEYERDLFEPRGSSHAAIAWRLR